MMPSFFAEFLGDRTVVQCFNGSWFPYRLSLAASAREAHLHMHSALTKSLTRPWVPGGHFFRHSNRELYTHADRLSKCNTNKLTCHKPLSYWAVVFSRYPRCIRWVHGGGQNSTVLRWQSKLMMSRVSGSALLSAVYILVRTRP